MEKKYTTSLDTRAVIGTLALPVLIIVSLAFVVMADDEKKTMLHYPMPMIIHGILLLVYGFCYAMRPISYTLSNDTLTINRLIENVRFRLEDVDKVEAIKKEDLRFVMRTFGNGGIFGYIGKYYHSNFGSMTWYATRLSNYVLITMKSGKKIILTPDDSSFVGDLASKIK